jgi:hypothetical protein
VLGPVPEWAKRRGYAWEVEYDNHKCEGGVDGARSPTSWFSRDSSIELTREAALAAIDRTNVKEK